MHAQMATLVRKELRTLWGTWLALGMFVVAAALRGRVPVLADAAADIFWSGASIAKDVPAAAALLTLLAFLVSAYAGAETFAGEKQSGTLAFLTDLPVDRRRIFRSKIATTVPVALAVAIVSAITFVVDDVSGRSYPDAWANEPGTRAFIVLLLFVLPMGYYACAVLFSMLVDTVVVAALGGIALFTLVLGPVALMGERLSRHPFSPLVGKVAACIFPLVLLAAALAALLGARRIFCGPRPRPLSGDSCEQNTSSNGMFSEG